MAVSYTHLDVYKRQVQIAANAVANNLDGMGVIPGKALSLAMITVVGRCIGARDDEQAVYYTRKLTVWSYICLLYTSPAGTAVLSGSLLARKREHTRRRRIL